VELLHNEETYELFIKNVSKFSGELHGLDGRTEKYITNPGGAMKVLRKLKEDNRISLGIHSIDGVNITESFWHKAKENKHDYYKEIIISGEIS
jgi:hypothetical protein